MEDVWGTAGLRPVLHQADPNRSPGLGRGDPAVSSGRQIPAHRPASSWAMGRGQRGSLPRQVGGNKVRALARGAASGGRAPSQESVVEPSSQWGSICLTTPSPPPASPSCDHQAPPAHTEWPPPLPKERFPKETQQSPPCSRGSSISAPDPGAGPLPDPSLPSTQELPLWAAVRPLLQAACPAHLQLLHHWPWLLPSSCLGGDSSFSSRLPCLVS